MKFTEDQLKSFASPIGDTEDQKCRNAIGMLRDALRGIGFTDNNNLLLESMVPDTSSYMLEMRNSTNNRQVKIFVQGSYANGTNVRAESDVDVAVVLESTFRPKYRDGVFNESYGFVNSTDDIVRFKDDVEVALKTKFINGVERKNKSIYVKGNTYRVDADAVPSMRHRDYMEDLYINVNNYVGGILIRADSGEEIVNYPEQHISNGRVKNNATNYYYKKMVRIIKKIRNIMQEDFLKSANDVSSFGLESLLWNVPNGVFSFSVLSSYRETFKKILNHLSYHRHEMYLYKEANGIKLLFPGMVNVENYKLFIDDISNFYQYDVSE